MFLNLSTFYSRQQMWFICLLFLRDNMILNQSIKAVGPVPKHIYEIKIIPIEEWSGQVEPHFSGYIEP